MLETCNEAVYPSRNRGLAKMPWPTKTQQRWCLESFTQKLIRSKTSAS